MKNKELFPKEFIKSSVEHYTFKIGRKNSGVYSAILISLFIALGALPFVYLDITSLASGTIDTKTQRFEITAPIQGRVVRHSLSENNVVIKGDILLQIDNSSLAEEIKQLNERKEELDVFLADVETLLGNQSSQVLKSQRYRIEQSHYLSNLEKYEFEIRTSETIYERQKKLFHQKVIAKAEFENYESNYQRVLSELDVFKRQAMTQWKEKALLIDEEAKSLNLKKKQLENQLDKYTLRAPTNGELQNVTSLAIGQFVQTGQKLAQITPDTTLLAICWVSPKKIGLLKSGMCVILRVDAFNYNDWGFLSGKIDKISSDAYLINDQPFFKVECTLEKNHLQLKNGFTGNLKKGMTFQASFTVARRTLYQLLHDKIDNWLNPTTL